MSMIALLFAPVFRCPDGEECDTWEKWWQALILGVVFMVFSIVYTIWLSNRMDKHQLQIFAVQKRSNSYIVTGNTDVSVSGLKRRSKGGAEDSVVKK